MQSGSWCAKQENGRRTALETDEKEENPARNGETGRARLTEICTTDRFTTTVRNCEIEVPAPVIQMEKE